VQEVSSSEDKTFNKVHRDCSGELFIRLQSDRVPTFEKKKRFNLAHDYRNACLPGPLGFSTVLESARTTNEFADAKVKFWLAAVAALT
jgi:hypothetical protein